MTAPIGPRPQIVWAQEPSGRGSPLGDGGSSFSEVFERVLSDASRLERNAEDVIAAFLRGEPVELDQVISASEAAAVSIELLVEVRNKLTDAYRAIMNMQV